MTYFDIEFQDGNVEIGSVLLSGSRSGYGFGIVVRMLKTQVEAVRAKYDADKDELVPTTEKFKVSRTYGKEIGSYSNTHWTNFSYASTHGRGWYKGETLASLYAKEEKAKAKKKAERQARQEAVNARVQKCLEVNRPEIEAVVRSNGKDARAVTSCAMPGQYIMHMKVTDERGRVNDVLFAKQYVEDYSFTTGKKEMQVKLHIIGRLYREDWGREERYETYGGSSVMAMTFEEAIKKLVIDIW